MRYAHVKGQAIVSGTLEILPDLPPKLAQGLFAMAGRYEALLRFSTLPGDIFDDSVSVPRGLALKIPGVAGERLPGSESHETQDFVLVTGSAFASATPKLLRQFGKSASIVPSPLIPRVMDRRSGEPVGARGFVREACWQLDDAFDVHLQPIVFQRRLARPLRPLRERPMAWKPGHVSIGDLLL